MYILLRKLRKSTRLKHILRHYSSPSKHEVEIPFNEGMRSLKLSTGQYARLADSCALATIGNTTVMVTCVSKPRPPLTNTPSFLPLIVDYRQKSSAAGRIPTTHLRRDSSAPTEREILTARLIDRSVRPLFPSQSYAFDTQLVCNTLAVDSVNAPDVAAINAASCALALSETLHWNGPVGAVRLGWIEGEICLNPTRKEMQNSTLNLVLTATRKNLIVMLEGNAENILQQDLCKAIKYGCKEAQNIVNAIEKLQKDVGIEKKTIPNICGDISEEVKEAIRSLTEMRTKTIFNNFTYDKIGRDEALNSVRTDMCEKIKQNFPSLEIGPVLEYYSGVVKGVLRDMVFEGDGKRCDGRTLDQLRKIECKIDLYEPLHGSAMFRRGQTQVFCTVTLDSPESALKMDTIAMLMSGVKEKNFFLHYEFPPFATKETGKIGGLIGRREIGHGALAEKGLTPCIPNNYPFTIRLTSEVLESNGSSSMASVCGGTLALLDAGVPISAPAAGVAMGLITRYDDEGKNIEDYRILTDLLGIEDYMGDMDFKLAGTKKGITALQADIKIPGLPLKIVMETIQKATDAKFRILEIMQECISKPRTDTKENWPVSQKLEIEVHKRAKLLGPGGINLRRLYAETGVQLTQTEDTIFEVFAPNQQAMDEAQEIIQKWLTADRAPDLEFGAIYNATIVEIRDIGVMVQLYAGMPPALLHNSQLDQRKVSHPSALDLQTGQEIKVKYFGRDPVSGLMRLSRKVLQTIPK